MHGLLNIYAEVPPSISICVSLAETSHMITSNFRRAGKFYPSCASLKLWLVPHCFYFLNVIVKAFKLFIFKLKTSTFLTASFLLSGTCINECREDRDCGVKKECLQVGCRHVCLPLATAGESWLSPPPSVLRELGAWGYLQLHNCVVAQRNTGMPEESLCSCPLSKRLVTAPFLPTLWSLGMLEKKNLI